MGEKQVMRLMIVDDDSCFTELFLEEVNKNLMLNNIVGSIKTFHNAENFLMEMSENPDCDVVFLDIEMPGMNGLKLAEKIREQKWKCEIIFLTSHTEYALEGYEFQPFYFIDKLDYKEKTKKIIPRIKEKTESFNGNFYEIEKENEYRKIYYKDLICLVKEGKYIFLYTKDEVFKERKTLDNILKEMDCADLLQVNRGSAVNMSEVVSFVGDEMEMRNGLKIPVSHTKMKEIKSRFIDYRRKKDGISSR